MEELTSKVMEKDGRVHYIGQDSKYWGLWLLRNRGEGRKEAKQNHKAFRDISIRLFVHVASVFLSVSIHLKKRESPLICP